MTPRILAAIALVLCSATASAQAPTGPAGTVRYYHADAVGSIRAVTDANGNVVARHDYFPFGDEPANAPNPAAQRFTGQERDRENGMDYVGARYYANRTGRFTTVDPALDIETALTDPLRWNRYAYALNNPLKYLDPDGRNPALLHWLAQAAQRVAASPAAQRAQQAVATHGSRAWVALTRLFNTPQGQEVIQTAAELATGAQAPAGLLPALTSTTRAAFLETALAEGRGGVSAAGRALQSHASRAGSWLAELAQGGNAAANTAAARKALLEILQSGQVTTASHKVWGDVVYVRLSDGRGAVWTAEGEFITFLERYSPKQ
jgi:RHS repeat-associated protein